MNSCSTVQTGWAEANFGWRVQVNDKKIFSKIQKFYSIAPSPLYVLSSAAPEFKQLCMCCMQYANQVTSVLLQLFNTVFLTQESSSPCLHYKLFLYICRSICERSNPDIPLDKKIDRQFSYVPTYVKVVCLISHKKAFLTMTFH